MIKYLIIVCSFLLFFESSIIAQDLDFLIVKKYAENSFRDGDYEFALTNYLELLEGNEKDIDINYKLGICYTETNIDKEKALSHLEFVVSHNNYPIRSYYYLGRSYMYSYRFTEAVEAFYEFKMMGISEELLSESDRLIEMCYYALEQINFPKNVTFALVDSNINSVHDDYYPFVSDDGFTLFYSSNRTYVDDFEDYISNVFYSESKKGNWSTGVVLPEVTTYDNEEAVGLSPEGDKILVYANGDYSTHDIKLINRKGSKFSLASSSELPSDINTEGVEMGACFSTDGNTLYYVSDKRGGRGGLDIYVSKKNSSGVWEPSQSIGTTINTEYDENFPSLSSDGKMLYFASKGHQGFGGYDLFSSFYNDDSKSWSPPINLGCPINTPVDNTTISYTQDGKTAYVSAMRKEGYGKLDVYKITHGDDAQQAGIFIGNVMVGTAASSVPYSEDFLRAYATFYDIHDNIIAQFPVGSDGGQFFASLYPGTYKLEVKFSGAASGFTETINFVEEFTSKDIYIKPSN